MLGIFTLFHVVISLIGIVSGFVFLFGLLASKRLESWTRIFLFTTAATSVTGFLFPFHRFMPSYAVGMLSLVVLALAFFSRRRFQLTGDWRKTFVISSLIALYLNVFVLVAQMFQKIPALHALAPTQSEPPFGIAQGAVLLVFLTLTVRAAIAFHPVPMATQARAQRA